MSRRHREPRRRDASLLLEAVTEVSRLAGQVALRHFRTALAVETKRDGSPVTIADRATEAAARDWIEKRFPGDAILGEELGASGDPGVRRWFIDPIDGTKSFVRGVPLWGTMIAVGEGDRVIAGAVNCAAAGELVAAAEGCGCWWNGSRCRVSSLAELGAATVLTTDDRFPDQPGRRERWQALADRVAIARTWGDCYGYVLVVTGRAEAMVDDRLHPWDVAPLLPLLREAGGVCTDWLGRETAFGGDAIATNTALGTVIRAALSATVG